MLNMVSEMHMKLIESLVSIVGNGHKITYITEIQSPWRMQAYACVKHMIRQDRYKLQIIKQIGYYDTGDNLTYLIYG